MCGRASLTKVEKELEDRFMATFYSEDIERYNPLPNYNVAPTHMHPVITNDDREHIQIFRWGLIPFWAKEISIGSRLINARIETIAEKPAFKNAVKHRRCLVPIDGFYEWKKTPQGKIPYRVTLKTEEVFAVAGLWEKWNFNGKETIHSFTMITQQPNNLMAEIHNRMPAILTKDQEQIWLDNDIPPGEAIAMIKPLEDGLMHAYTVSNRVNKVSENDIDLLKEVPYTPPPEQGSLF